MVGVVFICCTFVAKIKYHSTIPSLYFKPLIQTASKAISSSRNPSTAFVCFFSVWLVSLSHE